MPVRGAGTSRKCGSHRCVHTSMSQGNQRVIPTHQLSSSKVFITFSLQTPSLRDAATGRGCNSRQAHPTRTGQDGDAARGGRELYKEKTVPSPGTSLKAAQPLSAPLFSPPPDRQRGHLLPGAGGSRETPVGANPGRGAGTRRFSFFFFFFGWLFSIGGT